jgi:hypothetical protein
MISGVGGAIRRIGRAASAAITNYAGRGKYVENSVVVVDSQVVGVVLQRGRRAPADGRK